MQRHFYRKQSLGLLTLALLLAIATLGVVAADSVHAQETEGHESCTQYNRFVLSGNDIDWGVLVLCYPAINFIYVEGTLRYYAPEVNEWFDVDFGNNTCYTNSCEVRRLYLDADGGLYQIKNCFSASSPTSNFPYSCTYKNYNK